MARFITDFATLKILTVNSQKIIAQPEPRGPSMLIEVPVTAGAQRVPFPDIPQLRSQSGQVILVKSITCITLKVLANGIINAAANMPIIDLQNSAVVLYAEGWEKGKFIPNLRLNDTADSDSTAATTIPYTNQKPTFDNWFSVDWSQSYIQFANGQPATTAGVFIYEVEYIKVRADNWKNGEIVEIVGPS